VRFESLIHRPPGERPALVFAFARDSLLVCANGDVTALADEAVLPDGDRLFFGCLDGADCFAVDLADLAEPPAGHELVNLRPLHGRLGEELWVLAGRAVQLLDWERQNRFCGRCGEPTERATEERALVCTSCRLATYPRLSPAVITLVTRGDELLLAQGVRHPQGLHSLLAGFVEPGESLEEAVRREVLEEVGIEVGDIRYFGSQPWPFPNNIMVAFTAEYAGGELRLDEREIVAAQFFARDALPTLPPPPSIARWVIETTLGRA
jgi:NAD+ diphosphatase